MLANGGLHVVLVAVVARRVEPELVATSARSGPSERRGSKDRVAARDLLIGATSARCGVDIARVVCVTSDTPDAKLTQRRGRFTQRIGLGRVAAATEGCGLERKRGAERRVHGGALVTGADVLSRGTRMAAHALRVVGCCLGASVPVCAGQPTRIDGPRGRRRGRG